MLSTLEKVIFLQEIDIFANTETEDLAYIAAIADEIVYPSETVLFKEGDMSDGMYLVIQGHVQIQYKGSLVTTAREKDAFGTWALFDDTHRVTTATVVEETRLLRIDRDAFMDLLADNIRITQGILKTLSKKLRGLLGRFQFGDDKG